eukprot:g26632.t1
MQPGVRTKLSVMMFLQYAIWGSWAVSLGGYMGETLLFSGLQIGSIYSTTAIAAMISPLFMGYIADRFLATEKMIGLLHLIGAALLGAAAVTRDFGTLYAIMILYSVCYMPTLALTNSISFANIGDPEKDFPGIRVWGTFGWIVVGWLVGFVLDVPKGTSNAPIFLAAGCSAALGLFSFTLPHTPPKSAQEQEEESASDGSRRGIVSLLSDSSFLVFVICSFLVCIPLSFYYGFANLFLSEIDAPFPTALQTIGQISEVGFMATMPFFILRLGVKRMLAIGMLAWFLRYACFGSLSFPLVVVGLVLHGICYDFFFVASQIYVDNRVSKSQRASAQSFIAFVTMGVGMFVGSYVGGITFDAYPPEITVKVEKITGEEKKSEEARVPLPFWDPEGEKGIAEKLNLKPDSTIDPESIPTDFTETDEKTGDKTIYDRESFVAALKDADKNGNGDGKVGQLMAVSAIGLWVAPFIVGQVCDRWMATEKYLLMAHAAGGATLIAIPTAAERFQGTGDGFGMLLLLVGLYAIAYFPTIPLASSLTFRHLSKPDEEFGKVRIWGTVGWVLAGWIFAFWIGHVEATAAVNDVLPAAVGVAEMVVERLPELRDPLSKDCFYLGAALSFALVVFCFFLPSTPPEPSEDDSIAPLKILAMFKDRTFSLLIGISFLLAVVIPLYSLAVPKLIEQMLAERQFGNHWVPAVMTAGQISEFPALILLPWCVKRFGMKATFALGMLAWVIRYGLFALTAPVWLILLGIGFHGICHVFLVIVIQLYVDNACRKDLRASAQNLFAFVTMGIAMPVGFVLAGLWGEACRINSPANANYPLFFIVPAGFVLVLLAAYWRWFEAPATTDNPEAGSVVSAE